MAVLGRRAVCYFGASNYWALFENGGRVGEARSPVSAEAWLKQGEDAWLQLLK
jgi:hypothetical protein